MNEIMIKTYELIDVLEKSDLVVDIERYKRRILGNEELVRLIALGNETDGDYVLMDIRKKLYQNDDYRKYMEAYNGLLYVVMEINSRYKELLRDGQGGCRR